MIGLLDAFATGLLIVMLTICGTLVALILLCGFWLLLWAGAVTIEHLRLWWTETLPSLPSPGPWPEGYDLTPDLQGKPADEDPR